MRVIAFVVVLSLVLLSTVALADVPNQISYQGTLTDGDGVALDTTVSMTFSIYSEPGGGTPIWTETQPAVEVSQGVFNVLLGQVLGIGAEVFFDPNRWLGITVFDESEMQPRQQIVTVGYAFRAAEADTADHVRGGGAGSDGDWTIVAPHMYSAVSGRVGIGTVSPQEKFHVADGNLIVGGLGVNNRIKSTSGDASIVAELFAYDGLGGYVGTFTNHKFVLRTNDLDRVTIDATGKVGIGTAIPQVKLSLGTDLNPMKFALWDGVGDFYGLGAVLGRITFYTNNTEKMTIYNNGNVGIGTTVPSSKLHVMGAVKSESTDDRAVDGLTTSSNEWVSAVYGRNEGAGDGLYGWSQSRHGIFGITFSDSTDHAGVYGKSDNDGPGVYGETAGTDGIGVYGKHIISGNYGMLGTQYNGVYGVHLSTGNNGYLGGDEHGVKGYSHNGNGVYGGTVNGVGVYGYGSGPAYAGYFDGDVIIDSTGWSKLGIGTANPTEELHVVGDIYCTGKLTSGGGNDPPYVLYDKETRQAIIDRVTTEVPEDKRDGAVLFWNGAESQLELYLPKRGEFRDLLGNLLAEVSELHVGSR